MEDRLKQGEALFAEEKIEEAEKCFLDLLDQNPEDAEALNNLGVIHHTKGNVQEAEGYFLKAVEAKEDYLDALLNLSNLYQNTKRWEEAAYQLEKCIASNNQDPNLYNQLGTVYLEMGDTEHAGAALTKSLELNPDQKAVRDSLKALEKKTSPSIDCKGEIEKGKTLLAEGKIKEAEKCFLDILESNPEDKEAYNNLGVIAFQGQDIEKAVDYFEKALGIDAFYKSAILNFCDVLRKLGQLHKALPFLEKIIKRYPDDKGMNQLLEEVLGRSKTEMKKEMELLCEQGSMEKPQCLNILIRGGGFVNKGAEAMLRAVQTEISKRIPGVQFFMEVQPQLERFIKSKGLHTILVNSKARYKDIDGVIDISGFALGDAWTNNAQYYHHHNSIFESLGRPIIFMPQAWGPFTNKSLRQFSAGAINLSDYAYARDKRSHKYISELEGVNIEKIGLAPDIAYHFKGASDIQAMEVLKANGLVSEQTTMIGIMPNMRVYERTEGKEQKNEYVQLLVAITEYFLNEKDFSIILIPHEIKFFESQKLTDDRFLCSLIRKSLGDPERVIALLGDYSSEIIKAVIGRMQLLIGSRYHGIIAAITQMIPPVVLGWSHKYFELLSDVELQHYIVDYKNLNITDFCALVDDAWHHRLETKTVLEKKIPQQVHLSAKSLDHAAHILSKGHQL